jgi:DNA-binding SARP family transcriptional activator
VPALVDALWGDRPPQRADATLEQHVWRLRKVIEPHRSTGTPPRMLVRTASGYTSQVVLRGPAQTEPRHSHFLAVQMYNLS